MDSTVTLLSLEFKGSSFPISSIKVNLSNDESSPLFELINDREFCNPKMIEFD